MPVFGQKIDSRLPGVYLMLVRKNGKKRLFFEYVYFMKSMFTFTLARTKSVNPQKSS